MTELPHTSILIALAPNALSALLLATQKMREPACPAPRSQPPGWVFGVVWPVLYLLLGLAMAIVRHDAEVFAALAALVLALNAWWLLFSPRCLPGAALAAILALVVYTAWLVPRVARVSKKAAFMLAPLAVWLAFASYLSYEIYAGKLKQQRK